jgi:hypothetical protein
MRFTVATVLALVFVAMGARYASSAPTPKATAQPVAKPLTVSKAEEAKIAAMKASAPADEYFGKMKLSFLGIDNTFRDQAIRAGDHTTNPTVAGPVMWAEDALRAWQKKYSHDPQLARTYYLAFLVDRKIWLPDFQQRATTYIILLKQQFATTYFGKQAKADLAKGMTMNFYAQPAACGAQTTGQDAAAPVPTADPKDNIKVNEISVPCYAAAPSPAPSSH